MEDYNSWWVGEYHPKYLEWKNADIRWMPSIVQCFKINSFALNFIIGPRQIGKTTAIAIFIHEKLLKSFHPMAIFYYACDELSDYRELGEVIDNYLNYRNSIHLKRSIIFLDEITFVEEWWRALKARIDSGKLRNDVIYISGSASIELMAGKERFPGRRGSGQDYYILPLTFNEYVKFLCNIPVKDFELNINNLNKIIKTNKIFQNRLITAFQDYLKIGGFPRSIREFLKYGRIIEANKIYLDWLKSDILKAKKSQKLVKEILSYIIRARLSPISWNSITKEVSASSPNTIREYVEFLENLFVLKIQPYIDPNGKIVYRKRKKIHIIDPFLYDVIARYTREETYEEQKVESIVATHIARLYDIYYWKNSSEIDIVIRTNTKLQGFEVKWSIKPQTRRYPINTIILNKEEIPLFLAAIKWEKRQYLKKI